MASGPSSAKTQSSGVELVSQQSAMSSTSSSRVLAKPVAIPQTTNIFLKSFSPFCRAYPPALGDLAQPIPQDEFLGFVDGLNACILVHPVFQLGWAVTYVPIVVPVLVVQVIGGLLHVLSALSGLVVVFVRTRLHVRRANRALFASRGLQCQVLSTKAMLKAVGAFDADNGRGGKLALPPPAELDGLEHYDGTRDLFAAAAAAPEDPRARRMRALHGLVLPASLAKADADPVLRSCIRAHTRAMNNRSVSGAVKRRAKAVQKLQDEAAGLAGELATVNRDIAAMERQQGHGVAPNGLDNNIAAKVQARASIVEEIRLTGARVLRKADKKEESVANKVLWIVITKADAQGCVEELA